jgi:hypothetical protein
MNFVASGSNSTNKSDFKGNTTDFVYAAPGIPGTPGKKITKK